MEGVLMSGPSIVPAYMRFANCTGRSVSVIWMNYEGFPHTYKILKPYDYFDVNSFVGHPWICEDTGTGDALLMNKAKIHYPENDTTQPPVRHVIIISIPVFRLDARCVQVVKNNIRSKTDVFQLNIPINLQKAIIECFLKRDVGI